MRVEGLVVQKLAHWLIAELTSTGNTQTCRLRAGRHCSSATIPAIHPSISWLHKAEQPST